MRGTMQQTLIEATADMQTLNPSVIAQQVQDAHDRTLALIQGLNAEQMMGPLLATVNPLRWEIGHAKCVARVR